MASLFPNLTLTSPLPPSDQSTMAIAITRKPQQTTTAINDFWSRGRQALKRKKGFYFMELPGEIRNRVYHFLYEDRISLDLCGKRNDVGEARSPAKMDKTIRLTEPVGKNKNPHTANWCSSAVAALHLCSRTMFRECTPFLYAHLTVLSRQMKLTHAFLDTVRPKTLHLIRTLHLHHCTYGEPTLLADRRFKLEHDEKWARTCQRIVKAMPKLQHLTIDLVVHDAPFILSLSERWVLPLLIFRHLKELQSVSVHVFSPGRRATAVDARRQSLWQGTPPHVVRHLIESHEGNCDIHEQFGQAVAMKVLARCCDECAMAHLIERVNGRWRGIVRQPWWEHLVVN